MDSTQHLDPAARLRWKLETAARLGVERTGFPVIAIGVSDSLDSWTFHGAGFRGTAPSIPLAALTPNRLQVFEGPFADLEGIRFVAATPIEDGRRRAGVVAAMDWRPRELSPAETEAIEDLADVTRALLAAATWLEHRPDPFWDDILSHLHRLATTPYPGIDAMARDYLRAGCGMLGLECGAVIEFGAGQLPVRQVHPDSMAGENSFARLYTAALPEHPLVTYPFDALLGAVEPFACYIAAPLHSGDELFGALAFCSRDARHVRRFSERDRELAGVLARWLGNAIHEEQLRRDRTRLTVELARQALQDPLTGLANRLQFNKHLESALARATQAGQPVAVGFIDLDRFKQVNDTLGHAAGDEVLREVGARLLAEAGMGDTVARVGGDEFAVLFTGAPVRAAVGIEAERIIDVLGRPYRAAESELFITASMGISFFPEDASEGRELLQKADAAMYRCKSQGKNDYRFFTPDIVLRGARRMEIETELRRALEKEELRICFMPLVDAASHERRGFEALLAWKSPRLGHVGAGRFIPIAEESGMIIPIGTWVLNEVCRIGGGWRQRGNPPLRIAVNVSPLQFSRPDFVALVSRALRESGMPPACLELELTESMIMRDVEGSVRRMMEIRELGVSIAIDDFGTGYSSLSYLRKLPVDTLKIDQSFVAELGTSESALPLIQTIVALAHNIGLDVVAEGVETNEQAGFLRTAGCDKLQGHLFGEPLEAEALIAVWGGPAADH